MENAQPRQHYKLYKSGKCWITAMVSSLFLATIGAINGGPAHADELPQDGKVSFAGPNPIQGHIQFSDGHNDPVLNIRVNDQVVFCINPFAHLKGGEYASSAQGQQDLTANYWQSLTKQQQNLINNAAYLAQAQGAAHDSETYFAGQLVVWSIISGQNGIPGVMAGSDKIDSADMHNAIGATITGWDSSVVGSGAITKTEQILNNAAAMGQRPNFSPAPLNILAGQSGTVTDTNGVLQQFKNINGSNGLSASISGNDLTVNSADDAQDGSIRLKNTARDLSDQPYYVYGTYVGNDLSNPQQPVFAAKDPSRNSADLQVKVKKANLKIDKSILKNGGVSTKDLTNGNYSLANNVFEVHKDTADGEVVATVTTDANGTAETGNVLAAGKYVVTEKQASDGLARTFDPVTVNVDSVDNLEVHASGTNKEVTGGISIQKKGAETGTQLWNENYSLAGNVFKIHKGDINGEVVDTVTTDENGYAKTREDLPLGRYVVEEVQASKGFQKTFEPKTVDINYEGQDKQVVLSMTDGTNQETKGRVLIDKSGEATGKNMINEHYTLAGNEFDVIDSTGKVVDHVTTDTNGKAASKDLPLGKYTIVETKASEGFAKTAAPKDVQLKYNGQDIPVVFDTAFETNKEVTGGIKIHKEGAESGKTPWNGNYSLKDNVFVVHKGDINGEVVAEVSTDANGYAETKTDLPLGHYVVEEKQASQGFLKTFIPQDVDITYAGQELSIVIASTGGTNQEVKGQLIIDKSGEKSGKNMINEHYTLAGNEFDILDEQNNVVDHVTTDSSGKAYSKSDLKLGKYTVVETKASEGFAKTATPQKVELAYNGQQTPVVFDTAFETNKEVTGGITIQKTGAETGTQMWNDNYSLAGNVFKIHKGDINGEVVDEVTTDANGYAHTREDLPLGTYVVEEVQASKCFVKTFEPKTVDITYAGQDKQVVLSLTDGTNQEVKGKIVVDKSGKESDKKLWNGNYSLAGNEFDVHENNELGKVVAHITTDENGHAETDANLPLGDYVVTESKASKGFVKTCKPQKVTLKYVGQTVALVADLARDTNQEVTGSTSVIKQDKQTGDKTQGRATFAGAEYTLYHADGTPVKWSEAGQPVPEVTVGKKVSRDNVTLRIDEDLNQAGVKHLALGDYYWKETKAPEGYQKDKEQYKFSINYQDEYTPVVTNEETSKEQVINFSFDGFKYTQSPSGKSQSGYDGIQLSLIPINGTKGEKQTVTTHTDANGYDGYYKFDNISYGDYELWEENAPEGYQHIDPLYVHIELNADKTAYVFTVTEKGQSTPLKKMTVPVSKIDEGTGNVYLSKLFLFDKSEDTKSCNGGGNNQPVINITNNNQSNATANPVVNNQSSSNSQSNPAISNNPQISNNNQQQQEENQQQVHGDQTVTQTGASQKLDGPTTTQNGGNVQQTVGDQKTEQSQTGPNATQNGGDVHQTGGSQHQEGATITNTPQITNNNSQQQQQQQQEPTAKPAEATQVKTSVQPAAEQQTAPATESVSQTGKSTYSTPATATKSTRSTALPSTGKKNSNQKVTLLALATATAGAIFVSGNFAKVKQLKRKKARLATANKTA
ncbi:SpaA isopeptide-forming pilin-related protein [Fructobacillus tropaeoli]|uniref:SpaA-like prealbumin fold domain-containing protein n=1 Tax=Fructobacillus tropaeoli TaxID=709323 RepID=A0A3F3HCZ0_9LACO|nr:SpaA isopeptide-forming pilin-related protein [Fructobacillus tropaeoli]GAP04830.1 hypothetical protein FTRO_0090310 [Fructobacillus tropaeoli]